MCYWLLEACAAESAAEGAEGDVLQLLKGWQEQASGAVGSKGGTAVRQTREREHNTRCTRNEAWRLVLVINRGGVLEA